MNDALQARHLRREFGSKDAVVAVKDVSVTIGPGQIVALLGPNGAGKTTTVKMCSTLLAPTSGSVVVDGVDAVRFPRKARRSIGLALGGEQGFYARATLRDNLLFFSDVKGLRTGQRKPEVDRVIHAVGLDEFRDRKVEALSRGMKQRLHLARAILGQPKLLLLDEPTNGLDPDIARSIRSLIAELAADGTGVLLTTHYLQEAEDLASEILVLFRGSVKVKGSALDIARAAGATQVTTFSFESAPAATVDRLSGLPGISRVVTESKDGRVYVRLTWSEAPQEDDVYTALGSRPDDLVSRNPTLEESYLSLVDAERN